MPTPFVKKAEIKRTWYVVDADGQVLGRLASRIARILTGKEKPTYAPFLDAGDHVIVVNAEKVRLTGAKETGKRYYHHSGYPGGIRQLRAEQVRAKHPERLVEAAVRGMLPKNRLGRAQFRKLKVYVGPNHPHQAQQPQPIEPVRPAQSVKPVKTVRNVKASRAS
jgi:large subunit ribosomal protein L13